MMTNNLNKVFAVLVTILATVLVTKAQVPHYRADFYKSEVKVYMDSASYSQAFAKISLLSVQFDSTEIIWHYQYQLEIGLHWVHTNLIRDQSGYYVMEPINLDYYLNDTAMFFCERITTDYPYFPLEIFPFRYLSLKEFKAPGDDHCFNSFSNLVRVKEYRANQYVMNIDQAFFIDSYKFSPVDGILEFGVKQIGHSGPFILKRCSKESFPKYADKE